MSQRTFVENTRVVEILTTLQIAGTSGITSSNIKVAGFDRAVFVICIGTTTSAPGSILLQAFGGDFSDIAFESIASVTHDFVADTTVVIEAHSIPADEIRVQVLRTNTSAEIHAIIGMQLDNRDGSLPPVLEAGFRSYWIDKSGRVLGMDENRLVPGLGAEPPP